MRELNLMPHPFKAPHKNHNPANAATYGFAKTTTLSSFHFRGHVVDTLLLRFVEGIKKAPEIRGFLLVGWWRRRELNPRPPVLSLEVYMLSVSLLI